MRKITATRMFNVDGRYCEADRISHEITWAISRMRPSKPDWTVEIIKKGCKIPSYLNNGIKNEIAKSYYIGLTIYHPITEKDAKAICNAADNVYWETI